MLLLTLLGNNAPSMPPRISWILLWFLLTGFTGVVRFVYAMFCSICALVQNGFRSHAIYGAGAAGAQLASALRLATIN